ncbi:MFS family permease [Bacillus pakistanensis]|uniref:MFS family permease n=1 Tax=Rossellomorea pakistanensis TaxID=992288 RepID=A0ABS2NES5_9BACI|nr:MFS transporter [Bacillus pakistanensis]MBM7586356.1 MFS family permease [Bacillus pakistanensis]
MKTRAFRFLWLGQAFANAGDVFYIVALIAAVYSWTKSPMLMTIVPVVITLSRFTSSILAPLLIGRYPLKSLLFYSQAVKTILMIILSVMVLFSIEYVAILFIFATFIAFLDGFALPARNALVPSIVKREDLMGANGFLSTSDQLIQFSGWAFGGLMVAFIGEDGTLFVTSLLFIISTAFMYSIPVKLYSNFASNTKIPFLKQLSEGWTDVWKTSILKKIFLVYALESLASVVWIAAILYIYVERQLLQGEEWWGFINSAFFAGLIIASTFMLKWHRLFANRQPLVLITLITAILTFLFGYNEIPFMALFISFFFGLFDQTKVILLQTNVQMSIKPERLGKVYAAQGALTTLFFAIGSLAAGGLVTFIGVQGVFALSSSFLLIAVIPTMLIQNQLIKETER